MAAIRVRAVITIAALASALTACGGGGSSGSSTSSSSPADLPMPVVSAPTVGPARTLTCDPGAVQDVAVGSLVNNMFNAASAGSTAYRQCLQVRSVGSALEYGWTWEWPTADGIYAYPELLVGSTPWSQELHNDTRFPRLVGATKSLRLNYEFLTTSTGKQAAAADFWFTATNLLPGSAEAVPVKAEMLIWTNVSAGIVNASDVAVDVVEIDGKRWTVYLQTGQGDASNPDAERWTLISYVAIDNSASANYDAAKFFQDAIGRGVIASTDYLSGVEIGHEIISGSGSAWLRNFSIVVE